jgi:hypothetical protein
MMATGDEARAALTEARAAYLKDMQWLREKYGIIPDPEAHLIKGLLQTALSALETDDVSSLQRVTQSFDQFHKDVLARTAWDLLEQTKRSLKALRETDPELFEEKLALWNAASWAFTTARFRRVTEKYREAIRTVTSV